MLISAIGGDADSWLVFLDLLEEFNPEARVLLQGRLGISDVFRILSKLYPNIVRKVDNDTFEFFLPLLNEIELITSDVRVDFLKYELFSFSKYNDYYCLNFYSPFPKIDGCNIAMINNNLSGELKYITIPNAVQIEESKIIDLSNPYIEKGLKDLRNIYRIFVEPLRR